MDTDLKLDERVTLADLLFPFSKNVTPRSVATLATAIEKFGIYGCDDYDRIRPLKDSSSKTSALSALKDLNAQLRNASFDADHKYLLGEIEFQWGRYDSPLQFFWWNESGLPDFAQIEREQSVFSHRFHERRPYRTSTYLNVVGALLEVILGKAPGLDGHSGFQSREQLIAYLSDQYRGYDGCAKSTMEPFFTDALRAIRNPK